MAELLLTADAGSQACKAEVFDLSGQTVSRGVAGYDIDAGRSGQAELDPAVLRSAFSQSVQSALRSIEGRDLRGMGISAQLGLVPVDKNGNALRPILTWMDRRASEQAKAIAEKLGSQEIYQVTGRRIDPEWPGCKILFLKEHELDGYRGTYKYLTVKDYLVQQITGRFVTDPTHASYSLLFNIRRKAWQPDFFETLEIDSDKVPEVVAAHEVIGETQGEFAESLGLPTGLPVVAGGPDGTTGALGAGLIAEGAAVNVAGTTDVFFACATEPKFDSQMRTVVNCHVVPGKWVIGGPMCLTGGCLKWFCDHFGEGPNEPAPTTGESDYDLLDQQAERIEPGSEKLLFIPSLTGDRAPIWNPHTRGALLGLSPRHRQEHVFRAILEGSAFSLKTMLLVLEEQGIPVDQVILVGGAARSPLWTRIRADVLGKHIVIPKVTNATGLGTAVLIPSV